jgi:membrane protein DedA with SNARE-associated domain
MHLLAHYGAVIVGVAMITEGCGIPVPAETILVTASALAARGTMSIWWVAIAAALGWFFGKDLARLEHHLAEATIAAVVLVIAWLAARRARARATT